MTKEEYVKPPGSKGGDYVVPPNNNDYVAPPGAKDNDYVAPPKNKDYVAPPGVKNNGYVVPPNDNDYVKHNNVNDEYIIPKPKMNGNASNNQTKRFVQKDFSEIKNNYTGAHNDGGGSEYKPTFVEKFKNIFYSLNSSWLRRHYIFSVLVFFLVFFVIPRDANVSIVFYLLCTFFYPFAMFIYESSRNFILGDTVILLALKKLFIWKAFKILFIWFFSIIIGPIGLIYLYFKVNKQ